VVAPLAWESFSTLVTGMYREQSNFSKYIEIQVLSDGWPITGSSEPPFFSDWPSGQ